MDIQLAVVSGGQTGADRAALDWAIKHNLVHGGWCPKGRLAQDGPIDPKYELRETPSAKYPQRTEWNVRDSDATVVFTMAAEATRGSKKTITLAAKQSKPCLHLHPAIPAPADKLADFVREHRVRRLNVAGSRAEKEPALYGWVAEDAALSKLAESSASA